MYYQRSDHIKEIERNYNLLLRTLDKDRNSYWFGLPTSGYVEGEGAVTVVPRNYLAQLLLLYHTAESKYYHDPDLISKCDDYFQTMLNQQNAHGLISLTDCNIDSPPDTAFHMNWYAIAYHYLQKQSAPQWKEVQDKILLFLRRAADGLLTGGIHTPNHRWVISCALSFAYEIFGDEKYKSRVEEFLSEGLDINAYGEWTEKSNSIYNAVCDLYLYHTASILKKDDIFEAIRKNLNMMKYMFHPHGYIVTEYSIRQDKAKKVKMGSDYAIIYQLMADLCGDKQFSWLAHRAAEDSGFNEFIYLYNGVYNFREIPQEPISQCYTVLLNEGEKERGSFGKNVLRHRRDDLSVTVMESEEDMIYIQYGNVRLFGISLVVGWFGVAAVAFPVLKKTGENEYVLELALGGSYLDLLPASYTKDKNGNWDYMDASKRPKINEVYMTIRITLTLGSGYVDIFVESEDKPHILMQLVCKTDPESRIFGQNLIQADEHNWLLTEGSAVCSNENSSIEITGGSFDHKMVNLRNYVTDVHAKNILINFNTPCRKTIRLQYDQKSQ